MKLLEQVETVAARRWLADATVNAYSFWIRSYLDQPEARHEGTEWGWRVQGRSEFTLPIFAFRRAIRVQSPLDQLAVAGG